MKRYCLPREIRLAIAPYLRGHDSQAVKDGAHHVLTYPGWYLVNPGSEENVIAILLLAGAQLDTDGDYIDGELVLNGEPYGDLIYIPNEYVIHLFEKGD